MVNIPGLPAGAFDATQTDWQPVHITACRLAKGDDGHHAAQPTRSNDEVISSIIFCILANNRPTRRSAPWGLRPKTTLENRDHAKPVRLCWKAAFEKKLAPTHCAGSGAVQRSAVIPHMPMHRLLSLAIAVCFPGGTALAALATAKESDWREHAARTLEMRRHEPPPVRRATPRSPYPWKRNIMTTVFWIGEAAAQNNPVPNDKSSWDIRWADNYGGYDNPDPRDRRGYLPAAFIPQQNPFYIALPYNDVTRGGTKSEAAEVVPWFKDAFVSSGRSVLKGRWLAIHYRGRVAFAQWEDVGPFRTDHWEYVFGDERPSPNRNKGAGLDISPAVRDYLGMKSNDYVDWRFVEFSEVPMGPWALHGENNCFIKLRRGTNRDLADASPASSSRAN